MKCHLSFKGGWREGQCKHGDVFEVQCPKVKEEKYLEN
jgi:hypothetical protein